MVYSKEAIKYTRRLHASYIFLLTLSSFLFSCNNPSKEEATKANTSTTHENDQRKTSTSEKENIIKSNKNISENSLGKRLFILCASCHNVKKDEPHKVGPNLNGFFGKKAATKPGFEYSDGLKNKGIVWSEETIREWLQNPASYVPGTKMAFVGVKEKEQQDALIAYLKEITKEQ